MKPDHQQVILNTIQYFMGGLYDNLNFDQVTKEELRDMWSDGQVQSKLQLLESFCGHVRSGKVLIAGGWYGQLAHMLNQIGKWQCDTLDIDPRVQPLAQRMAGIGNQAITADMIDFDYSPYQVVVNTSCEHVSQMQPWLCGLKPGQTIVLQSNNAKGIAGHVNCVESLDEFVNQIKNHLMIDIKHKTEIALPQYTRYQVIALVLDVLDK